MTLYSGPNIQIDMIRGKAVRIQHFRSILDSGEVDLESEITALIGENESGKTNFLEALRTFNRGYSYSREDLCSYVREELLSDKEPEDIPIITIWFQGSLDLFTSLGKDGITEIDLNNFKITKYFDNHYEFRSEDPGDDIEELLTDLEKDAVAELGQEILSILNELERISEFKDEFGDNINTGNYEILKEDIQDKNEFEALAETLQSLIDELDSMAGQSEGDRAENALLRAEENLREKNERINKLIERIERDDLTGISNVLDTELFDTEGVFEQLPNFIFHEDVEELPDSLEIDELRNKDDKHRTFRNLLFLAGLDVQDLHGYEAGLRFPKTRRASATITGEINKFWEQEDIEINIDIDGSVIGIFIDDESGSMDRPSNRSKGFLWFLSFYINFMAGSRGELKNSVLLLDDPGVFLHPSGQKNLLETLEELTDHNQIVYNTHSPFLIDKDRLQQIRILNREEDGRGTIVTSEFHDREGDALAPIRAAFGAQISDSLFGNRKNILVEGYSDKILLDCISKYFRRRNKSNHSLDPDDFSVINAGGAPKMPYFARLLEAENYDYIILLDSDNQGRQQRRALQREDDIEDSRIFLLDDFVDPLSDFDATTEDLFDPEFYHQSVVSAHKDKLAEDELEHLDSIDVPTQSLASQYSQIFNEMEVGDFRKTEVARQIRKETQRENFEDATLGQSSVDNFVDLYDGVIETLE